MQKPSFDIQEMDLRIQWSLLTRIRAEATAYKSTCAGVTTDSLKGYLSALESLAEYVATRCRGAALFEEAQAAGMQEFVVPPPAKVKRRGPRFIPFPPKTEAQDFAAAGDAGCERLVG